jgi:hypothetical protein
LDLLRRKNGTTTVEISPNDRQQNHTIRRSSSLTAGSSFNTMGGTLNYALRRKS